MGKTIYKFLAMSLIGVWLVVIPGCYDLRELEQNAFVLALGLDISKTSPNFVKATVMIAIPKELAGTGGGGGGGGGDKEKGLLITSIEAPSFPEAINLINTYVGRELNFKQASFIFFGDELAKKEGVLRRNFILRYYEIRRSTRLFIVRGEASEVINQLKPKLSANPNKYLSQIIDSIKHTGLIPDTTLHRFNEDVENPTVDGVIPLCAINPKANEKEITDGKLISYEDYLPGEINRINGVPIEFIGGALFKKDIMIGEINGSETRFLNMIKGNFDTGIFIFPEIVGKMGVNSIKIIQTQRPSIKINIKRSHPQIVIKISLEGEIISSGKMIDYSKEANIDKLEADIEKNLELRGEKFIKKLQKLNNDPLDLGNQVAGKFLTYQELKDYGWLDKGKYRNADIKLDFRIQIRRIGYQLGPTR